LPQSAKWLIAAKNYFDAGLTILAYDSGCIYKRALAARTGEICMTCFYAQIAPARPKLMPDAFVAV